MTSSCVIEELSPDVPSVPDPAATCDFDVPLGRMLSAFEGDVGALLTCMFSYLSRRTNFFKSGDAQSRVLGALQHVTGVGSTKTPATLKAGFLSKKDAPKAPSSPAEDSAPTLDQGPAQSSVASVPATSQAALPAAAVPADTKPSAAVAGPSTDDAGPIPPLVNVSDAPDSDNEQDNEDSNKSKGLKPNQARGYDHGHYSWGQTLPEVSVSVPVPAGTKARQLEVVLTKTKLKVGLKGQSPILEGELSEPIKADDSMWNIEGGVVELTLCKQDGMHWWSSVVKGEPLIDVQKVEPENSKLSDLDAETRQTVEKMMFDQRQKAMGLPTSDEMNKQEMLKKFMAAHPEMDFSKAKMM